MDDRLAVLQEIIKLTNEYKNTTDIKKKDLIMFQIEDLTDKYQIMCFSYKYPISDELIS